MKRSNKMPVKEPRPGTKRATVLKLMQRKNGTTWEQIQDTVGWDRKTAYDGVRLIRVFLGWNVQEDEKGRLHAHN